MKHIAIVLLLSVVAYSTVAKTPWQPCKGVSGAAKVTDVEIPGCDAPPCQVKQDSSVTINVTMSTSATMNLTNHAYGVLAGVEIPFPNYPANESGKSYTEMVKLPIGKYPTSDLKLVARWKLKDTSGKEQGCFEIPLEVKS